ncbi:hypothetical protein FPV67DRAFT_1758064 [Lyophyllum atratum]|nr:hypothetical protein FPV67DRAFT_1758064 [Lyophyllum atratum]
MSGSVTISGIAVLENSRALDPQTKPKSLTFDTHLFLNDSCQPLASLRYYNGKGLNFSSEGIYFAFLTANISKVPSGISELAIASSDTTTADYMLVGDIVNLILAESNVDVANSPYITVSGAVDLSNDSERTFELCPEPWTSYAKDANANAKTTFPTVCQIPQWKGKAQIPKPGAYVTVGGFVTGMHQDEGTRDLHHFTIDVDKVTFLGRAPIAPKAADNTGRQQGMSIPLRLRHTITV